MSAEPTPRRPHQRVGMWLGPLLAGLVYALLPETVTPAAGDAISVTHAGRATAAIAVWMATWWLSEAIEVYATALLPLVLLPLLGARSMKEAAAPYAHELIFLFMGGFLLALAMERWGLHRRVALVALGLVGERPANMVAGFMAVTAVLSMWVSNTATAIMMLPVALSVIELVTRPSDSSAIGSAPDASAPAVRNFSLALLLGIAYSASIGGIATPIGTPPNLFLLSYVRSELGLDISFARWMAFALPLAVVFLPLTWWLLTRWLFPVAQVRVEGGGRVVREALAALGPLSRAERLVGVVFAVASLAWITRPLLTGIEIAGVRPLQGLTDAGIAMSAAVLLFVLPVGGRRDRGGRAGSRRADGGGGFVLDWSTAKSLPWGILVLFGGGLSLASAIRANGLGELLAAQVATFAGVSTLALLLGTVVLIVFLTELTSNTATTATLIPVLAGIAPGLGLDPLLLIVPAALSASCAFMLPVATPPNAIVFGSGLVPIAQMSRAGFWLNWIGVLLITGFGYAFVLRMLG